MISLGSIIWEARSARSQSWDPSVPHLSPPSSFIRLLEYVLRCEM